MTRSMRRKAAQTDELQMDTASEAKDEPSWFFEHARTEPRDVLMERYRRHIAQDTYRSGAEPRSNLGYRDLIAARSGSSEDLLGNMPFPAETGAAPLRRKTDSGGMSVYKIYVLAAAIAVISGASVGYLASKMDTLQQQASALFAAVEPPGSLISLNTPGMAQRDTITFVSKKKVATATLRVADVSGQSNVPIPLLLYAEPGFQQKDLLLKISGLPDQAYLTSGRRQLDNDWALTLADSRNVKLLVLEPRQQKIELAVSAFEPGTGELAAPVKAMTVALTGAKVQPAAAPPPQSSTGSAALPPAIPPTTGTSSASSAATQSAARAMADGNLAMKSGDAVAARRHFEQAWLAGSADGAMAVARSYDPLANAPLKLKDTAPNTAQALLWYERAAAAGKREAIDAIARLKLKP